MVRGGKRTGAGRPSVDEKSKRQTLTCRVAPETKAWLDEQKEKNSIGIGELVDTAIETLKKQKGKKG